MTVEVLPPVEVVGLHPRIPQMNLHLVIGPVQDCEDTLIPIERDAVLNAVKKRRHQFATGRMYARQAIQTLGITPNAIKQGEQREPIWQSGIRGSISHTDILVASAVTAGQPLGSVGIDLEQRHRLGADLYDRVLTPREIAALPGAPVEQATIAFSAKEAIYKAMYPLEGRYIGFQEVEVDFDWSARCFTARYVGVHPASARMHEGKGYISDIGEHVFTLFFIPGLPESSAR